MTIIHLCRNGKEALLQIKKYIQTALINQKIELLVVASSVVVCFLKNKCTVLNAWIEDVLTLAYSESRLTLIISATAIILGIYIAVISIIATSVLGITEDMIRKGKHEQLLHIVFTGMMVNSILVFLCVLFDVDTGWKAVIISAFLSISIVSFFKFMWLLFLIFQANFLAMGKSIEEDRRENQELLTILNKIERKIKD